MQKIGSKISKAVYVVLPLLLAAVFYALASGGGNGRLPWHQQLIFAIISPFQKSAVFVGRSASGVWNHYFNLVSVAKENEILNKELQEKKYEIESLREVKLENDRLRGLLSFAERFDVAPVAGGDVIANDPRADFRSISVNRGSEDGVQINMPVISGSGLVGRVADLAGSFSRALLITDPNSAVDVIVQRSRARAILKGSVGGTGIPSRFAGGRLEYLQKTGDVAEGDVIVTSGMDGIFPAGIPVGTVSKLKKDTFGIFLDAEVAPFVDFSNLEEVLIVKR